LKMELSEACYRFFSTLANPTRLAVLENLIEGPMSVSQLTESLGQEQSMVSHNLKPLLQCRFVNAERRGKERIYHVNSETMGALFKAVKNHAETYCPTGGMCPEGRRKGK
jgi:DNA-binding transcriptional ArsR family regulator